MLAVGRIPGGPGCLAAFDTVLKLRCEYILLAKLCAQHIGESLCMPVTYTNRFVNLHTVLR